MGNRIIENIDFDLNFIKSLFDSQIKKQEAKNFILSFDRKFLDTDALTAYLFNKNNPNPFVINGLHSILKKASIIVGTYNIALDEVEKKTDAKDNWYKINFEGISIFSGAYNYECKQVENKTVKHVNLTKKENRRYFAENNTFNHYTNNKLANEVALIANKITTYFDACNIYYSNELIKYYTQKSNKEWFTFAWWQEKGKMEFEEVKQEYILKTDSVTENKITKRYLFWLQEKLKYINQKLSDKHPNGNLKSKGILEKPENKIELILYKQYLENKIKELTGLDKKEPQQKNSFKAPETTTRNHPTKHFVFTYILDCKASNKPFYHTGENKKDYLKKIAFDWDKYTKSPATFERLFFDFENTVLTENNLLHYLGEDWKSIVLELSTDKSTLQNYLARHFV